MKKEVIMEAMFSAKPMSGYRLQHYLENPRGYVDVGGFAVNVDGVEVPFNFESTVLCEDEGRFLFGNFADIPGAVYDVDPCHEEEWAELGLTQEDITAELLASADRIGYFNFEVSMNDRVIPCYLELEEMAFWDEQGHVYAIEPEVLMQYNRQRVAEQVAEFIDRCEGFLYNRTAQDEKSNHYLELLNDENPTQLLSLIRFIQAEGVRHNCREYGDFLIDSMMTVAASKDLIYRVSLNCCGNIDHGENPYAPLDGAPVKYAYCNSISDCQSAALNYIKAFGLGSGQWGGGLVYQGNQYAGLISYNGRFWDKEHKYGSAKSINGTEVLRMEKVLQKNMPNLEMSFILERLQASKEHDLTDQRER